MKFPKLQPTRQTVETLTAFGGYNRNAHIRDGEFYDMRNLSGDGFPLLTPRKPRKALDIGRGVRGMIRSNGLCYAQDKEMRLPNGNIDRYCGLVLPGGSGANVKMTVGDKELLAMGSRVILLPDKKWVNVAAYLADAEPAECCGDLESAYSANGVTYQMCDREGNPIDFRVGEEKPESPGNGAYWLDDGGQTPVLMRWYGDVALWQQEESFLRIELPNDTEKAPLFCRGDVLSGPATRGKILVSEDGSSTEWVYIPENPQVVQTFLEEGVYSIVIPGLTTYSSAAMTFYAASPVNWVRKMPEMDFVIESGNRLWGCKYGRTEKGFVNEIYASALGDPTNWHRFQGISTDSYVASIGCDGPFTGAVNYLGKPIFFKENAMICISGDMPSNYRVQCEPWEGVRNGCGKSLAVVDGILYYKSRTDVCAYDGTLAQRIGGVLGDRFRGKAVAGGYGKKYYISMEGPEGWELFVYDTVRKLWHKEDELEVVSFGELEEGLCCVPASREDILVLAGDEEGEETVRWMAQTGPMGLTTPDARYISRLQLKLSMTPGTRLRILGRYDSNTGWEHICTLTGTHKRSFTLPIRPRRSDSMTLRLEGEGFCCLHAITKIWEEGGLTGCV